MHYGNLAKAVRDERRSEAETLKACVERVEGVVEGMAERRDGGWRVGRCGVEVLLGKASATGTGVRVGSEGVVGRDGREVRVRFEGCRVMVLIGVNAIERTARQRLEVDLEVRCAGREALGRDVEAFGLEREMVEVCLLSTTAFAELRSRSRCGLTIVRLSSPRPSKRWSRWANMSSSTSSRRSKRRCLRVTG